MLQPAGALQLPPPPPARQCALEFFAAAAEAGLEPADLTFGLKLDSNADAVMEIYAA